MTYTEFNLRIVVIVTAVLLAAYPHSSFAQTLKSKDGKYEAKAVPSAKDAKDVHYEVREIPSGRLVLRTYAQYPTSNDVKGGGFSTDSKKFGAAYHYGHDGNYTWIGIWSVETGKLVGAPVRLEGWSRDVSPALQK